MSLDRFPVSLLILDREVPTAETPAQPVELPIHLPEYFGQIMTTMQIELPEATARAAREAGLLTAPALERLLNDAIRRKQAADSLLTIADRVTTAGISPMTMEEINAEVKAARAERRQRAGDH